MLDPHILKMRTMQIPMMTYQERMNHNFTAMCKKLHSGLPPSIHGVLFTCSQVEVTDGSPETEEPAYAVLEQEIPDPEQGISDPEQGIPDPEQETPDPEQGISDPELVPDNSGHSTMHV